MSITKKDLLVNITCIEAGIVPVSGVENSHVYNTLAGMDENTRRRATRKFRKILKKAIRKMAREQSRASSYMTYESCLSMYMKRAGLGKNSEREHSGELTRSQSNFRRFTVMSYIFDAEICNT
tara:strand:- start:9922 stop:10290 length:369 start_codon:yes stop_codon:yes gene_type:complete